jgi:hypothetical protein
MSNELCQLVLNHDDYVLTIYWHNFKQGEMIKLWWTYFIFKVPQGFTFHLWTSVIKCCNIIVEL